MTLDALLDGVLAREGGWRDATPRPNAPPDPATHRGITLLTLQYYRERYHGIPRAETTEADLRALTETEARQIYAVLYVQEPGFTEANVPFEPLRVQLIDFGVNSGPERAVRWLQRVLRLPDVTGRMDAATVAALQWRAEEGALAIVNDALVAARSYMIRRAVAAGKIRKEDQEGLLRRAFGFILCVND